jgi:energy-coupling factor transporter ATP-binding protein EcfA2
MGSMTTNRTLSVNRWDDIAANYAPETRQALDALVIGFTPGANGKLLLFHGEPGTGKSTALASLAHAWSDWASVHLVVDPEALLSTPKYLLDVVTGRSGVDAPWRLVILEDSGELFAGDARHVTGQALSRLLNVTDGMLAQGSKVLFAISTNEPLHSFHAAVARPGRCAASVEFQPLPATQAKEWLVERGAAEAAKALKGSTTIAQLYAMAAGAWEPPAERHAVGFYV